MRHYACVWGIMRACVCGVCVCYSGVCVCELALDLSGTLLEISGRKVAERCNGATGEGGRFSRRELNPAARLRPLASTLEFHISLRAHHAWVERHCAHAVRLELPVHIERQPIDRCLLHPIRNIKDVAPAENTGGGE